MTQTMIFAKEDKFLIKWFVVDKKVQQS